MMVEIFFRLSMNIRFLVLVVTLAFLKTFHTIAVPAKPGPITYVQPDGTTVSIYLNGDEHSHLYTDVEGNVLIDSCNTLYYATIDGDSIKASCHQACDRHRFTDECRDFLSTLNKESVRQVAQRNMQHARSNAHNRTTSTDEKFGLMPGNSFPCHGEQTALVILVEFSDTYFNDSYDPFVYFSRLLNEPGFNKYGATGSASDYFLENSKGIFHPLFALYGPVRLEHPASYYGANDIYGNDIRPEQMVIDACRALDDKIDFSFFDCDNDEIIDNVFVFYAGRGEASGGLPTTIWPHSWNIPIDKDPIVLDGKLLRHYACTNEWNGTKPDGIGTFLHEFSHVLGLPDLYATDNGSSFTPGNWDIMASGSYNNDSRTPPLMSTFERFALGWSEPRIAAGTQYIELHPLTEDDGLIIPGDYSDEIFFIENRQQQRWDSFVPGHGMLVWHVCYDSSRWRANNVNTDPARQLVDIVEATGDLSDYSRDSHTFPGSADIKELSATSHPAFSWSNSNNPYSIVDITENDNNITAKFSAPHQPIAPPLLSLLSTSYLQATVSWNVLPDIETYKLSVSNAVGGSLGNGYRLIDVGNSGEYTITGLSPLTTYTCRLYACQDNYMSAASEPMTFFTEEAPFGGEKPIITEVNDIKDDAFYIAWCSVNGADGYIINLSRRYANGTMNLFEGFSKDNSSETGWNTNVRMKTSIPENCGTEPPALIIKQTGGLIDSPEFSEDISAVSFWAAAKTADGTFFGNPTVTVYGSDGDWTEVGVANIRVDAKGTVYIFNKLPTDIRRLRLRINGVPKTDCFIDDISVNYGILYTETPVDGFPITVYDNNSKHITGLSPDTEYLCTIEAFKGDMKSLPSDIVSIITSNNTYVKPLDSCKKFSVTNIGNDICVQTNCGTTVTLFTIDGKTIGTETTSENSPEAMFYGLSAGIYLIRAGTMVQKYMLTE